MDRDGCRWIEAALSEIKDCGGIGVPGQGFLGRNVKLYNLKRILGGWEAVVLVRP